MMNNMRIEVMDEVGGEPNQGAPPGNPHHIQAFPHPGPVSPAQVQQGQLWHWDDLQRYIRGQEQQFMPIPPQEHHFQMNVPQAPPPDHYIPIPNPGFNQHRQDIVELGCWGMIGEYEPVGNGMDLHYPGADYYVEPEVREFRRPGPEVPYRAQFPHPDQQGQGWAWEGVQQHARAQEFIQGQQLMLIPQPVVPLPVPNPPAPVQVQQDQLWSWEQHARAQEREMIMPTLEQQLPAPESPIPVSPDRMLTFSKEMKKIAKASFKRADKKTGTYLAQKLQFRGIRDPSSDDENNMEE